MQVAFNTARGLIIIHNRSAGENAVPAKKWKPYTMNNHVPPPPGSDMLDKKPLPFDPESIHIDPQVVTKRSIKQSLVNRIPDFFTSLRIILGFILIGSGIVNGAVAIAEDIWLLVASWSTDMVDGRLSRTLKTHGKTWLGRHDVYIDMFVSLAVLAYMTVTAVLPLWIVLVYLLVWGAIFARWGLKEMFAQIFQNPIYLAFVVFTVIAQPAVLPWLLLWAFAAFIFFYKRMFELLRNVFNTVLRR